MIFWTISEPLTPSITSVSFMAGAPSSTAYFALAILRAVDDVGPVHQLVQIGRVKPHFSRAMVAMNFVHERKLGIVHFLVAALVSEVLGVFGRQERALVMIEPPGQARVGGVLEIDDGVLVAVEHASLKQPLRFVRQAGEGEFRAGMEPAFDEAAEEGRGGGAVEAVVVIEDAYPHRAKLISFSQKERQMQAAV